MTYGEEIPCNTTNGFVFTVQSHHDYTLTNCAATLGATAGLALTLNSSSSGVVVNSGTTTATATLLTLMNISITVTGGSVLPLLVLTGGPPALHLENISIRVVGVRVGPFTYNQSDTATAAGGGMIRSMVSIFSVSSNVSVTARNISLSMEDSIVDITSQYAVTSSADAAKIGSMFAIRAGGVTTVSRIQVSFRNSRIALRYVAPSTTSIGLVSLVAYSYGSTISNVDVTIQNSTVAIVVNASYGLYPAAIGFQCVATNGCILSNIYVSIRDASSVAVTEFVPAFTVNATGGLFSIYEVAAIVSVIQSTQVFHIFIEILLSTVDVAVHCTSTNCGVATIEGLHAGIVWISGQENTGNLSNFTLTAISTTSSLQSCGRTQFFTIANYEDASAISVTMENSTAVGTNGGQNYGSQTRIFAIVSVYNIGTPMSHFKLSILNTHLAATMESGSCFGALVSALFVGCLITFTDISMRNLTVIAGIVNGTAAMRAEAALEVAILTTITAFVILKQAATGFNNCDHVAVRIRDSFLASEHTTSLPVGATMVATSSLICSITSSMSLSNSFLHLMNVRLERRFALVPQPSSWYSPSTFGIHVNATVLLQLVDPAEFIPAAYEPLLAVFLGGNPAPTVHENVTVTVEGNCSIVYGGKASEAQQLPSSSSDRVSLLCLPSVANLSTYIIQDVPRGSEDAPTIPSSSSLTTTALVTFGSLIASTGGTTLVNANITVRRVALTVANLLAVASGSLWMKGSTTTMQFMDVTYLASSSLLSAYQYVIAAMDGGTIVMDNSADHGDSKTNSSVAPFLLVTGCDFRGYVSVIMPSVMNVSLMLKGPPATASKSVLQLGCNLWDGEPLLLTAVAATSEDATTLRSFISYPRSYFNISILCLGANGPTATAALQLCRYRLMRLLHLPSPHTPSLPRLLLRVYLLQSTHL